MSTAPATYHHGDLPATLVRSALELLEEGSADLSLRAVARRAGVAASAPYRHYADREALLSAVAGVGYRQLADKLVAAHPLPSTPDELADVAVAYVRFALGRPALFRVMFGEPCDPNSPERVAATEAISAYVNAIASRTFPGTDPEALGTAVWGLVHGLAFLFLDGKLDSSSPEFIDRRVRGAVHAVLTARQTMSVGAATPPG